MYIMIIDVGIPIIKLVVVELVKLLINVAKNIPIIIPIEVDNPIPIKFLLFIKGPIILNTLIIQLYLHCGVVRTISVLYKLE